MSYYAHKNNKYPQTPDVELDLHGYTTFEAGEALDEIIKEGGYSHIRIIVGKGRRSVGGPVLPDFVKNYLNARGIRWNQSLIQNGGEGALEVFFK
jgi:DNA-nicking Smr family endonuclease